ncbi:MAG: hypothetical protein M9962_02870 [Oligoflexia bacterium]|nr:hypothetical protein [Oligoflexia bacterium]
MKIIALTITILLTPIIVLAGDVVGNGGHVISCLGQAPITLDYHEREYFSPGSLNHLDGMSQDEVFQFALARLGNSDFASKLEKTWYEIGDTSKWILVPQLEYITDHGLFVKVPNGCSIVQAVIREGQTIYFNSDIASKISSTQLGVLALHEVIYKLSKESKAAVTSMKARAAVATLLSKRMQPDDHIQMIGYEFNSFESLKLGTFSSTQKNKNTKLEINLISKNLKRKELTFSIDNKIKALIKNSTNLRKNEISFHCNEKSICYPIGESNLKAIKLHGANEFDLLIGKKEINFIQ